MAKRTIIGIPGHLTAQAMIHAASQTGGMFVKPTDLGGSIMAPLRRMEASKPTPPIGKLQKPRGRL